MKYVVHFDGNFKSDESVWALRSCEMFNTYEEAESYGKEVVRKVMALRARRYNRYEPQNGLFFDEPYLRPIEGNDIGRSQLYSELYEPINGKKFPLYDYFLAIIQEVD